MKKGKYIRQQINDAVCAKDSFVQKWLPILLIIVATAFVYSFSLNNEATNWDDDKYIDQNPLLKTFDSQTFYKMFASTDNSERYFMGNYHPLTMLSLNIDYHLSDLNSNGKVKPIRFIVINILLHLMSVFFVYMLCRQLFRKKIYQILIPLLFAIHTLHVESVTWIAERKDVLYTMFYFLALWLYTLYKVRNNLMFYFLSLIVFVLSCFSKGQAVSLSLSLFVVDYFLSNNISKIENIGSFLTNQVKKHLNKIPFLIISLIFGLISIEAQKASTALQETDQYELYKRVAFGSWGFLQYILRTILPLKLSCLYPYPDLINRTVPWFYWLAVPVFAGFLMLNLITYWRNKVFTFGLLFYIVNIILLLQFIPVGSAMFSDRYSYIASIGLYILIAYGIDCLISKQIITRNLAYICMGVYVVVLAALTINREQVWKNTYTLWSDCTSKYPEAVIGWNNLGSYVNVMSDSLYKTTDATKYLTDKNFAIQCFTNGIYYKPDYVHCFYNRGLARKDVYEFTHDTTYRDSALSDYDKAIFYDHNFAPAFQNRALIYDELSESFLGIDKDSSNFYFNLAISDFDRALDLKPDLYDVYINRGATYGKNGHMDKAFENLDAYISHDSSNAMAYNNRGLALNGLGRFDEALDDFDRALKLSPDMESAYFNKSITHRNLKQYEKCVEDLENVVRINPNNAAAYYYKGIYNIQLNKKDAACDDFNFALQKNYAPAKVQIDFYCKH